MNSDAKTFLEELLNAPGVSGYEESVQDVVKEYVGSFADKITKDLHGNLIIAKNPDADVRIMLAGHCDQIGLIVSYIDDNGFLFAQTVGGWDPQQLVGQRITIWTATGPINGVIARKPIHLLDESEKKQVVKAKELWIDIGASDKDDAESVVQIGDCVTLQLGFQPLLNGFANAPAMDDRSGVWVVVEALRRAVERGVSCGLFSVSTVQEEIGLRGAKTAAYGIDPQIGIAVDVCHATDCPTIEKKQRGEINLGDGPVIYRGPNMNRKVSSKLIELAGSKEIPHQVSAMGRAAPNDSNSLQVTRSGVATGLVAIPNRYMHSPVETIHLDDIDHAAELLAEFTMTIGNVADFIP